MSFGFVKERLCFFFSFFLRIFLSGPCLHSTVMLIGRGGEFCHTNHTAYCQLPLFLPFSGSGLESGNKEEEGDEEEIGEEEIEENPVDP